jgi:uncharacterized protein (TIGR02444 family)
MAEVVGEPPDSAELWRFSLAFYACPEVPQALIALQDRAGFDVNLILFALWLGVSGRNRLSRAMLAAANQAARPIRTEIVEPLRALRRRLKGETDADIQRLREGVKALELAAERIAQNRLVRIAGSTCSDIEPPARLSAAYANLALYLGPEVNQSAAAVIQTALEPFVQDD